MFDHIITLSINPTIDVTLWVDRVRSGENNTVYRERYESIGRAMNVTRALRVYNMDSHALAIVGSGNRDRFEAPLKEQGLHYTLIPVEGYTKENITVVQGGDRTATRYLRKGPSVSREAVAELIRLLTEEVREGTLVVISGMLPEGFQEKTLEEVCAAVRNEGGEVALDTSARFTMEEMERVSPWAIKPNRAELEGLAHRGLSDIREMAAFCRELVGRGVRHCLVTLGDDGVLYTGAEGVYRVTVPDIKVGSAVGSGDYCLAGFVLSQATGKELVQSLRTAAAFGTAACLTDGSSPPAGIATASILQQVVCEKLV